MAYIPSSSTLSSQADCSLGSHFSPQPRWIRHPDLITFLAVVQHRQIDYVPLTWQEGLGLIGRGGTARIGQTHVNHEVDFAFKRPSQFDQLGNESNAAHIYEVFVTEILILTDPAIRGHANVANLIGYCWEVTEDNCIYPVLVLEKAKGRNLRQWLESFESSHMSFEDRLGMCVDIASALEVMHKNNIVHGDLKPENILVFKDDDETLTTRLSDFGYSCFGCTDRDIIYPSYSEIWSAPECHDRGMELQKAKLNDIYAFGLISIYILFMECTGENGIGLDVVENSVWDFYLRHDMSDHIDLPEWIGKMKSTGRLLDRTLEILADKLSNDDQKAVLIRLFRSTLTVKPDQREPKISNVIELLEIARTGANRQVTALEKDLMPQDEDVSHLHFRVSSSITCLIEAHQSVRKEILLALERRILSPDSDTLKICQSCNPQVAFELAICYRIGFGVSADAQRSAHFLSSSGKEESDILKDLQLIKQAQPRLLDDESPLAKFAEEGSLRLPENLIDAILDLKGPDQEAELLREISDMDAIFGDSNALSHVLKMNLIAVYEQQGKFQPAESACRIALQAISEVLGECHAITLECIDRLARIVRENGDWAEAETLQQSAVRLMTDLVGKDHIRTKRLLHSYCDTLDLQGRFRETGPIRQDVFNSLCVLLGARHPEVIIAMDKWATAQKYAGDLGFAKTLHHLAYHDAEQDLGLKHSITLTCQVHYADIIREQGDYEKAEDLHWRAVQEFQACFGIHHLKTAQAQQSLGLTFQLRSKWLDALAMYYNAFKTRCMVLGDAHVDTITSNNAWRFAFDNHSVWLGELQTYQEILRAENRLNGDPVNERMIHKIESSTTMLTRQGNLAKYAELHSQSFQDRWLLSKYESYETFFGRKIAQVMKSITSWKAKKTTK